MVRIEVITTIERRRRWPRAEQERLVAAMMEPASVGEIAHKDGVDPSLLYRSRQQLAASYDVRAYAGVRLSNYCPRLPLPASQTVSDFGSNTTVSKI
jgi:transposase-like protein